MFLDACALVSVLSKEPEAPVYQDAIDRAEVRWTTALAAFEAILVLARPNKFGVSFSEVEAVVLEYLSEKRIELRDAGAPETVLRNAVTVADRYGAGKKKLSTLDCFHYAAAKTAGSPMLTLDKLLRETDVPTLP